MDNVKIGSVVKLRKSFFDQEICGSTTCQIWMNKYLYEDEFEYVLYRFPSVQKTGDQVKTIFGSSESVIIKIQSDNNGNPWIVETELYEIRIKEALQSNEVSILDNQSKWLNSEMELVKDLEFYEKMYLDGLLNINERENNKREAYRIGFSKMIAEGKWIF